MIFCKLILLFLVGITLINVAVSQEDVTEEHDHYDGDSQGDEDYADHRGRHETHHFDEDPHSEDSDYDEDLLTGTSHHTKRDEERAKKDLDEIFEKIDQNHDGKIERNELQTYLTANIKKLHNESTNEEFTKVDTNMDNKVTFDEYSIFEHHDPAAIMDNLTLSDNSNSTLQLRKTYQHEKDRFKIADSNGDGFLTEQEYLLFKFPSFFPHMAHTIIHEHIEDLDENNDGTIEKQEYVDHFQEFDKGKDIQEQTKKKAEEEFDKYDKDKNGKIDAGEYMAILKPGYEATVNSEVDYLFKETDSDKDGKLSLHEVEDNAHVWLGGDSTEYEHQEEEDEHDRHLEDEL